MTDVIDGVITDVMRAEGWDRYTDNPHDRGGPTKWGITLKAWRRYRKDPTLSSADLRKTTEEDARGFYRKVHVEDPGFHQLHPLLIPLMVDCGVNHGVERSAKWLQKAVGAKQDGDIGPKTLAAVGESDTMAVYLSICAYRFRYYGALVSRDHSQAVFASGWNNRGAKFLVSLAELLKEG